MAINVHKSAEVHAGAEIGDDCNIGPFCTGGANVTIGNNTTLRSHVVIDGHTSIGQDCDVFPFVTLGVQSQDLKYVPGTVTYARIGHRTGLDLTTVHPGRLGLDHHHLRERVRAQRQQRHDDQDDHEDRTSPCGRRFGSDDVRIRFHEQ